MRRGRSRNWPNRERHCLAEWDFTSAKLLTTSTGADARLHPNPTIADIARYV